jgi:hypothetical protein
MLHYSPLDLQLEATKLKLSVSKISPVKAVVGFRSKLRTAISMKRPQTTKETLVGLQKRNCQVPELSTDIVFEQHAPRAFSKMKKKFFVPHADMLFEQYRREPIVPTEESITYWVSRLPPQTVSALRVGDFSPFFQHLAEYDLMLKAQPKPKTEMDAAGEYSAVQTILAHKKAVNAFFSPIFMQIRARLDQLLKPNVLVHMKKTRSDIEVFLRTWEPRYDGRVNYVENDFSKFDKSQLWVALRMEWYVYAQLGLDPCLLKLWAGGHMTTTAASVAAGVKIVLELQRKSGDATTALGNTIVNMLSVADTYDIDEFYYAMFIGDDSVIATRHRVYDSQVAHEMANIYNLAAKTTQSSYGFFCSAFIVKSGGKIRYMSDPVKRTEKLGAFCTLGEDGLRDQFQSLGDLLDNYDDSIMNSALAKAVKFRYNLGSFDVTPMIDALYTVSRDYKAFRGLYESAQCEIHS